MFNRNLIQLVRFASKAKPLRLDSINPGFWNTRFYSSKSSSSSCRRNDCTPCQDEPKPDPECGCETPSSKMPEIEELCEEVKAISSAPTCPSTSICNQPKEKTSCESLCKPKPVPEPPKPEPKSNTMCMLMLLALLLVAAAGGYYLYHEHHKTQEAPKEGAAEQPPPPPADDKAQPPTDQK